MNIAILIMNFILRRITYYEPKSDGYRSIHLVFRYQNDRAPEYNGLFVELQIRTRLQHTWATAVETMGTFLGEALKARQGPQRWLEFFAVAGAAFAHLEHSSLVPGYDSLTQKQTFKVVSEVEKELKVLEKLRAFSIATDAITRTKRTGSYHLVILDSIQKTVRIVPFPKNDLERATAAYSEAETRANNGEPLDVVLVSAGRVGQLRRAYPNYFLDTNGFIKKIEQIIGSASRSMFRGDHARTSSATSSVPK